MKRTHLSHRLQERAAENRPRPGQSLFLWVNFTMDKPEHLRICIFDHDNIKNQFSRFTNPHGIVGPHLKRPGAVFSFY